MKCFKAITIQNVRKSLSDGFYNAFLIVKTETTLINPILEICCGEKTFYSNDHLKLVETSTARCHQKQPSNKGCQLGEEVVSASDFGLSENQACKAFAKKNFKAHITIIIIFFNLIYTIIQHNIHARAHS